MRVEMLNLPGLLVDKKLPRLIQGLVALVRSGQPRAVLGWSWVVLGCLVPGCRVLGCRLPRLELRGTFAPAWPRRVLDLGPFGFIC